MTEHTRELNERILRHEAETPMREHDEDGTCCLQARLTPLTTPADQSDTAAGGAR
jgi:hypothetical protein